MISWFFNHLKSLKKSAKFGQFWLEIAIIIFVKIALLWLLWWFCFSQPIAKDARQSAVTRLLLNK